MEYLIVMPAYNEAEYIGRTINSIAKQSLLPKQLIVVNDGSTDRTGEVVEEYAQQYPWIRLVNHDKKEGHAGGAKVIRAFYIGYDTIDIDYDILVKLDADLELDNIYFEKIVSYFKADPKLGIAGGTIVVQENGEWVYENFSDQDHVKGAYKAYRRACFEQMGGLRRSQGWDTVDELLAFYHGWTNKVDESLKVKHYRPMGTETGSVKVRAKIGHGMYRMRYGFWITLISAGKAGYLNKPYIVTGLAVLVGWFQAWWNRDDFIVNEAEGKFIRQFRWERMKGKILSK